jgi:non-ribosomal peptide synthetase component F
MPEAEAGRLANVRLIITGGEACSKELVNRWAQAPGPERPGRPRRRFFNTYGPTEVSIVSAAYCVIACVFEDSCTTANKSQATVIATFKECFRGVEERMSIGKPLLNYQCYIVDEHMNLLPPGALGELVIGGVSVSRRYVGGWGWRTT